MAEWLFVPSVYGCALLVYRTHADTMHAARLNSLTEPAGQLPG
jgi:hypothetical protein